MYFLINLEAAAERRAHMMQQFDALGLQIRRVGIDYRHQHPRHISDDLRQRFPTLMFDLKRLSGAEAGCWASHLTAWRLLLDSARTSAIVIEDDLVLGREFASCAAIGLSSVGIANKFDVVFLGTSSRNISSRQRFEVDGLMIHRPHGAVFNTWAYLVQRHFVERFFDRPHRLDRPIDHLLGGSVKHGQAIGVVQPCVVSEDPMLGRQSQIGPLTRRIDRSSWIEGFRRKVLESRLSDLYYRTVYRVL